MVTSSEDLVENMSWLDEFMCQKENTFFCRVEDSYLADKVKCKFVLVILCFPKY